MTPEEQRLDESHQRTKHWKRWGPYLSERQWGTVREDYSPNVELPGEYFPHAATARLALLYPLG